MDRRTFLARTTAASLLGLAGGAEGAEPCDPMLDLLNRYRAAHAYLNASDIEEDEEVNAYCEEHLDPLWDRLGNDTPAVTTMAGALSAISAIASEEWVWPHQPKIAEAVRVYLEGRL